MKTLKPGDLILISNAYVWLTHEPSRFWHETGLVVVLRIGDDPEFVHLLSRRGLTTAYASEIRARGTRDENVCTR